jgi:uncharacterized integral membrane protein
MRTRLQKLWLVLTVAYAVIRIALAHRYLRKFGLSVPAFAAIELTSSVLFGFASGRFVPAVVDRHRRHMVGWGSATLVGFMAPDLFAMVTTRRIPQRMLKFLAFFIFVTLGISAISLFRRIRTANAESHGESHGESEP